MRYRVKQYVAVLLAVILTAQAPIALALTCVSGPLGAGEMAGPGVDEEKCHEMSDGLIFGAGATHLTSDLNSHSGQNDDFKLCQSDCCCVALPAPAIQNESVEKPVFQVETSRQDFTGRLISTYLKSDIRPPIS
jgi:hypothetical protein